MKDLLFMKELLFRTVLIILICLVFVRPSLAESDQKLLQFKVAVGKLAQFTVEVSSMSFRGGNPDENVLIPAIENGIKIKVRTRAGRSDPISLYVLADGDLVSGSHTIPVHNVSWRTSGEGFKGGALSKGVPQVVGAWEGSGIREGVLYYYLDNSWNYPMGQYEATITYMLTIP